MHLAARSRQEVNIQPTTAQATAAFAGLDAAALQLDQQLELHVGASDCWLMVSAKGVPDG